LDGYWEATLLMSLNNFIRYKYIMDEKVSNSFAAEGIQYSKDTSYYALATPVGSGLGAATTVSSVNGATGDVVITGANGVIVSVGLLPQISLGDITPPSITTTGPITGAEINAPSATFNGAVTVAGALTAGSLTSTGTVNGATVTATGALNATTMAVTGALSAGSFNATGALGVASFTNGSLGATALYPMVWGTTNQATIVIAGWRFTWGMALPSDTAGNITVAFSPAFASPPALSTLPSYGSAAYVIAPTAPTASGFSMTAYNGSGAATSGITISWIAMGQA